MENPVGKFYGRRIPNLDQDQLERIIRCHIRFLDSTLELAKERKGKVTAEDLSTCFNMSEALLGRVASILEPFMESHSKKFPDATPTKEVGAICFSFGLMVFQMGVFAGREETISGEMQN